MSNTKKAIVPCDDRCMFAKGDDCDCECGGENHKQGFRLTSAQRAFVRTPAGRRVSPLQPRTPDYSLGRKMAKMHQEQGMTKREIATALGVSAPTVRRYITRYLLAVEVYYHKAA